MFSLRTRKLIYETLDIFLRHCCLTMNTHDNIIHLYGSNALYGIVNS